MNVKVNKLPLKWYTELVQFFCRDVGNIKILYILIVNVSLGQKYTVRRFSNLGNTKGGEGL